jgi:hypothetical protein
MNETQELQLIIEPQKSGSSRCQDLRRTFSIIFFDASSNSQRKQQEHPISISHSLYMRQKLLLQSWIQFHQRQPGEWHSTVPRAGEEASAIEVEVEDEEHLEEVGVVAEVCLRSSRSPLQRCLKLCTREERSITTV